MNPFGFHRRDFLFFVHGVSPTNRFLPPRRGSIWHFCLPWVSPTTVVCHRDAVRYGIFAYRGLSPTAVVCHRSAVLYGISADRGFHPRLGSNHRSAVRYGILAYRGFHLRLGANHCHAVLHGYFTIIINCQLLIVN